VPADPEIESSESEIESWGHLCRLTLTDQPADHSFQSVGREHEASKERSLDGHEWNVFHAILRSHLQTALGSPQTHLSHLRGKLREAQLDLRSAPASGKMPVIFSVETLSPRAEGEASKEKPLDGRGWDVFYASLRLRRLTALGSPQEHLRYLRSKLRGALT
jgi:hypothetical protein